MSRQFHVHSGARVQFPLSNQQYSTIRRELINDNDWTEEVAPWRQSRVSMRQYRKNHVLNFSFARRFWGFRPG